MQVLGSINTTARFGHSNRRQSASLRKFDDDLCAGIIPALNRKRAAVQFCEPAGDGQTEAESLLLLHLAIELHVGAHLADLLGGKTASMIANR